MFNLFKKKETEIEIYCQSCNQLILRCGFVSPDGRIFCDDVACIRDESNKTLLTIQYKNHREIIDDIRDKRLIYYSKLEEKV